LSTFNELNLAPALLANLTKNEYAAPYPIQTAAIPAILSGKDVLGIAQTGSGKTASFVLPILQQFQRKEAAKNRHIKALVLVPTRELAVQVGDVFTLFSVNLPRPVKILTVFGGVSINPQMKKLMGVEILVATPGRFLELVENKAIQLLHLDILVLDEADKMLNLGFKAEMTRIFGLLPTRRQNLLFSATLGLEILSMSEFILKNPVKIEIRPIVEILGQINQIGYRVIEERKGPLLRFLIKNEALKQVLVFVSSIDRADKVVNKLKQNGILALALHGDKTQNARTEALRYFKSGEINVLVATDLASRGLDIPLLPTVINYELPRSPKDFIHRIGRTGRAGSTGTAISFVTEAENHHFRVIQKKMDKIVEMVETAGFDLLKY
jgi:ATP-dependent RNA helicase RhlE